MVVNSQLDFHMEQSEVQDDTSQNPKTLLPKFTSELNGENAQNLLNQELDPVNDTSKVNDQINDSRIEKFLSKGISLGYDHMRVLKALEKIDEHTSMSKFLEILIRSEDSLTHNEGISVPEGLLQNLEKRNLVCIDAIDVALSFSHGTCLLTKGIEICKNYFQNLGFTQTLIFVSSLNRFSEHESSFEYFKFLDKQQQILKFKGITDRRWADFLRYASLQKAIFVSNVFCKQTSASLDEVFRKFYPDAPIITYHFDGEIFEIDALATFQSFSCKRLLFQCPYGKNCTYGNKCKYFHPERGSEPRLSVTDMLMKKAGIERKKLQKTIMENKGKIPTKEAGKIDISLHMNDNEKLLRIKENVNCKNAENIGRFHIRNIDKSLKPNENAKQTKHEKKRKQTMMPKSFVNAPYGYNDSYFTWTAGINTGPQPFEISRGCSLDSLDPAQYPCYRNCANVFLSCNSLDSLPAISFAHSLSNLFNDTDCDPSVLGSNNNTDFAFPDNYDISEASRMPADPSSKSNAKGVVTNVASSDNLSPEIRNSANCRSSKAPFSVDTGISFCSHSVNPKENSFASNTVVYNNDSFQEDKYFNPSLKLNQIMEWGIDNDIYSTKNSENWLAKTFLGQIHEADEDI